MDLDNYLHGECHIFAWALHLEFGYPMRFAFDYYDLEIEGEVLIHTFCINCEDAIDARGRVDINEVLYDFNYNEEYFEDVTEDRLKSLIEEGFIHSPDDGQLQLVRKYIRSNIDKYK